MPLNSHILLQKGIEKHSCPLRGRQGPLWQITAGHHYNSAAEPAVAVKSLSVSSKRTLGTVAPRGDQLRLAMAPIYHVLTLLAPTHLLKCNTMQIIHQSFNFYPE